MSASVTGSRPPGEQWWWEEWVRQPAEVCHSSPHVTTWQWTAATCMRNGAPSDVYNKIGCSCSDLRPQTWFGKMPEVYRTCDWESHLISICIHFSLTTLSSLPPLSTASCLDLVVVVVWQQPCLARCCLACNDCLNFVIYRVQSIFSGGTFSSLEFKI